MGCVAGCTTIWQGCWLRWRPGAGTLVPSTGRMDAPSAMRNRHEVRGGATQPAPHWICTLIPWLLLVGPLLPPPRPQQQQPCMKNGRVGARLGWVWHADGHGRPGRCAQHEPMRQHAKVHGGCMRMCWTGYVAHSAALLVQPQSGREDVGPGHRSLQLTSQNA